MRPKRIVKINRTHFYNLNIRYKIGCLLSMRMVISIFSIRYFMTNLHFKSTNEKICYDNIIMKKPHHMMMCMKCLMICILHCRYVLMHCVRSCTNVHKAQQQKWQIFSDRITTELGFVVCHVIHNSTPMTHQQFTSGFVSFY